MAGVSPVGLRPDVTRGVTRGAARLLRAHGFSVVLEMTFANGRRADVAGLGARSEFVIVEVKSGIEDFRTDRKWREYADFCDRFFFAVAPDFPTGALPLEPGLIMADSYSGEFLREAPAHPLNAARRKAVTAQFARLSADRLQALIDPEGAS